MDAGSRTIMGIFDTGANAGNVSFSPDGRALASPYQGNRIALWDFRPASLRKRACDIVNRNMTPREWAQYMGDLPYSRTCAF